MQPEVTPTPQPQQLPPQDPIVQQAFQSAAPYPPAQTLLQPIDQNALKASMKPQRSMGSLIVTIVLVLLLLAAIAFGVWAFMSREDYKNNSDQKAAVAVEQALVDQKEVLDAEYAEKEKQPNDTYIGKPEAGSVQVMYPKTWSAHIIEQSAGQQPINGYFHPGFVPDTNTQDTAFALRLEVTSSSYAETVKQYESQVKAGTVVVTPYRLAKVPDTLGVMVIGTIVNGREKIIGTMVIMPIRDKTLKIWTESNSVFAKDFNETVLPNLSFVP